MLGDLSTTSSPNVVSSRIVSNSIIADFCESYITRTFSYHIRMFKGFQIYVIMLIGSATTIYDTIGTIKKL